MRLTAVCLSASVPQEADCERAAMDVKYSTDTKIEDNTKAFKLQKAQFDREVNTAVRPTPGNSGRWEKGGRDG